LHKNTLYITFDGLSDPLGQSQILPYICGIAANGFAVTILSCEKKERLEKEKEAIDQLIKDLPITWHYVFYDLKGGVFSRFLYTRKLHTLARSVCKEKKIDLIHCRSYLASLIGLSFKLKHTIPFVFDMRGFWANERIDGGIWKKSNFLHLLFYNYFKKKEKQFIEHSDAIVSLTNAALIELEKQFPDLHVSSKTTVIPCCTNTVLFNKENLGSPMHVPRISENDHVVVYTGSVGTWYYTREMIDCLLVWQQFIPNIKLLILTKDREELARVLTSYSLEQRMMIVSASSSYKDVSNYLSIAKAAMFFIKPSYSKIASSPTKMAECWAMNLPIITNSGIGDNDLYFINNKGGILIADFNKAEYTKACHAYLKLNEEPGAYRQIALDHFDTRMAVAKYTSIYRSLIG
jgi:glycosyltransferase involved in cell wall biosynthesis